MEAHTGQKNIILLPIAWECISWWWW